MNRPTLAGLVADPERVEDLAPEVVPGLLSEVEAMRERLWGRLLLGPAGENGAEESPEEPDRLLIVEEVSAYVSGSEDSNQPPRAPIWCSPVPFREGLMFQNFPSLCTSDTRASGLSRWLLIAVAASVLGGCDQEPMSPEPTLTPATGERALESRPDTIFNSYLVALGDEVTDPVTVSARLVEEVGGYRSHVYSHVVKGFAVANLPDGALSALQSHPLVRYVSENPELLPLDVQDVSADPYLWGLDRVDEYARQLNGAHYYFFPGTNSHIYIVDSGIAGGHEEFTGRLGNGVAKIEWSWDPDPYIDALGHGTAVASMAGGTLAGVAKQAILHSVRIDDGERGADCGDIVAGLDWVAANHINPAVANLSYETDCYFLADAMQGLLNSGVMLTVAAGNDGVDACGSYGIDQVRGALVVSATRSTDYRPSWGNWGPCVDLFAPGVAVRVAGTDHNADYTVVNGTSYSAPMVAGLVANLYSNSASGLDPSLVHSIVTKSATAGVVNSAGSGSPNLLVNSLFRHVILAGPSSVESSNTDTSESWRANTWGGDGTWTFVWEERINGGPWSTVGTSQSYTRTIEAFASYDLELRVSATSFNRTRTSRLLVTVKEGDNCVPDEMTVC